MLSVPLNHIVSLLVVVLTFKCKSVCLGLFFTKYKHLWMFMPYRLKWELQTVMNISVLKQQPHSCDKTQYSFMLLPPISVSRCCVIIEMPTVIFRVSQIRIVQNFLGTRLTSATIREVSSMGRKEILDSKFSLWPFTLTDTIFIIVYF